jgi:hypothetical protein
MDNASKRIDSPRKAPQTDDQRWSELLKRMAVASQPGVYVLGCFAQHVTFYSQQVRAMNLIDALCKTGTLAEGGSIGVVGAGLAGLSVTAAALKRGISVHLFEKDADPQADPGRMPLQTNSDERWVDPFIYDWPFRPGTAIGEGSGEAREGKAAETNADLPLMNWTAETASEVRKQILSGFRAVVAAERRARGDDCIRFYQRKVEENQIGRDDKGRLLVKTEEDSPPIVVDALILAVGFGVEDNSHTRDRYWTNDGLAGNQANGKSYLVSGTGDGGLTDVMRLCIADFKHRTVLDTFQKAKRLATDLELAVKERPNLSEVLVHEAGKISISVDDLANSLASRNNTVYLTGSPERLLGNESKASMLNRLIVAWLLRNERFKLVDARLRTPVKQEGQLLNVEFLRWDSDEPVAHPDVWIFDAGKFVRAQETLPARFNEVVVRHGPGQVRQDSHKMRPLEENFPTYWKESRDNQRYWQETPHWDDWTRWPVWKPNDFTEPPPPLDTPANSGPIYLVVEHPDTERFVETAFRTGISKLRQSNGAPSNPTTITLDLVTDFENPHRFGRAVRELCRAHIAVFDLTEVKKCPEALVLLGIRAVARRGITLVTARFEQPGNEPAESEAPFAVPKSPFLLRDIGFYGWGDEEKFIERLKKGIEEGQARAERLGPIYRDLPAYQEVRHLGPEPEDYRVQGPDDAVLLLTPFEKAYRKSNGSWLRSRVGAVAKGSRIYIVESPSPERTSSKLYTAIRRTQLCVVDWTGQSPNVFFEFGVRLAVSPKPAICVIHHEDRKRLAQSERARGILDLFRPLDYDNRGGPEMAQEFEQKLQTRREILDQKDSAADWPLNEATLSPDFVYRQVRAAIPNAAEDWSTPVWKELRRTASLILGSKPDQYPDLPVLFGDDDAYKRQAAESAMDRLLAAWYFLERRYNIQKGLEDGPISWEEDPWKSWLEIGRLIARELKYDSRADYMRMRGEIDDILQMAKRRLRHRSK